VTEHGQDNLIQQITSTAEPRHLEQKVREVWNWRSTVRQKQ